MTKETKLRTHSITAKAALKFGSETDEQRLEASQIILLRHLLGISKLYRERNKSIGEKLECRQMFWK